MVDRGACQASEPQEEGGIMMPWTVKIREGHKEPFRPNKRPYTTLKFSYANEVQDFIKSLVNYEAKPIDLKFFYDGKKEAPK